MKTKTSKISRVSFKNSEKSGPYRSFQSDSADIKEDGKIVGSIQESRDDGNYSILFHIKDAIQKGGFRNVVLKARFPTMQAAKDAIRRDWVKIKEKWNLHQLED